MRHLTVDRRARRAAPLTRAARTCAILAIPLALLAAPRAQAGAGGLITDQAVSLSYGPSHWDGTPEAALSGAEPGGFGDVVESGWFYRIQGVDTREFPFPAPDSETYVGSQLTATWANMDGKGLQISEVADVYDQEGPSGVYTSRIFITNTTAGSLTIHFYNYLNGDMLATPGGDSGLALRPRILQFSEGASVLRYSWRGASHYLVRPNGLNSVRAQLNDANADTFDDSGLPISGDWTAGFQTTVTLGAGQAVFLGPVVVSVNLPAPHAKGKYNAGGGAFPDLCMQNPSSLNEKTQAMRRATAAQSVLFTAHPANTAVMGLNDFDNDLFDEFVDRDVTTGQVYIGQQTLTGAAVLPFNWKLSAAEDFDNDSKADLLWRNTTSQKLVIWTMNGRAKVGNIVPTPDQAVNANWEVAGIADFNHDTLPDFLWQNQTSGNVVIWYMDATVQRISGAFTNPTSVGNVNWKAVAVGDFGKGAGGVWDAPDIVWQNDTSAKVVLWFMDHAGNRTSGVFTTPDNFGAYKVVGPH